MCLLLLPYLFIHSMCVCVCSLHSLLQIIDWFEQYAEEFFETHTEIGESLEVAQALITELLEFEESTKVHTHTIVVCCTQKNCPIFEHIF